MENKPNKTSKPAPQEKNKKEPNYYKKINQIARLLENQKISQIVVHGGKRESKEGEDDKWKISTDLDAESAVILFNLFNKKPLEQIYKEGARTSIIPKDNTAEDLKKIENEDGLTLFIDTGNKWLEIEKQNKKIYIDHHGKGRGPNTSATKMVYDLLKKQNPKIEEENPWLFKYVKGVNDFDNLNYLNREYFNKEHFEQVWPYTLNHIASQMKASDLMNLFNSGIITDFSKSIKGLLNEEIELEKLNQDYSTEIRKIKFGDITLKNGKTINEQIAIETSKNIGENNVKKTTTGIENADKFETGLLGKVVFNDNKRIENKNTNGYHKNIIPNHLAFIGTKALGYNTYIAWNEKDKNFFINSNEEGLGEIIKKLNEADPDCALDVRGVMVFGTIKNLTKEQFKKILELNEKIGNEKIKTNKNLTENEIKIQKNNEEIAELKKEVEEMDAEIAKLQAMILALPDDEPEPTIQPQAINEPQITEQVSVNENGEKTENLEKPNEINFDKNKYGNFDLNILNDYSEQNTEVSKEELEEKKSKIIKVLLDYKIEVMKIKAIVGPTFTLFEIVRSPDTTISKIKNLEDDILSSLSNLNARLIIPIPGKDAIGIEVPNNKPNIVSFKEILEKNEIKESKDSRSFKTPIGKNGENKTFNLDLQYPTYIAGNTGQGKSILMNTILSATLLKNNSSEVKFVLIDTKKDDFSQYNKLNKDYIAFKNEDGSNVISNIENSIDILKKLGEEMDNRYDLLVESNSREIGEYNNKIRTGELKDKEVLPKIILAIDEINDLMLVAGKDFEIPLAKLAQLSRATGIHIVIATQRPSINNLTGIIKANFPNKIGTKVFSRIDSRTILDGSGAEALIGKGDILLNQNGELSRIQSALITNQEIERIIEYKNKELEKSQPDEVEVNQSKENKIIKADFKELVRLSKFFLENPKEPTTVGSVVNKYPELFEEITKIERKRLDANKIYNNLVLTAGDGGFTIKQSEHSYKVAIDLRSLIQKSPTAQEVGIRYKFKTDNNTYHYAISTQDQKRGAGIGYVGYSVKIDENTTLSENEIYEILEKNVNTAIKSGYVDSKWSIPKDKNINDVEKTDKKEINAKYDEELAELEKTQVEKVEVDESERKKTERLAKSAAQSIAEGIIAMNSKENTKSVENSKIIRLEELKKEIQENINKLLENPEAKKFNPKILKFELSRTEEGLNISTEVYLNNVPVIGDVTIKLNLDLGNENKNIIIKKHKISTDSFFATGKVKSTIEPLLPKLVPQIKSYLENKLGYEINTLKINKGDLYINL